jgi:pyruvate ferredoxin oxidoreductase beta subunit
MDRPSLRIANDPSKKKPIEEYLKAQGRFRHLYRPEKRDDLIQMFQEDIDKRWEEIKAKCGV